MDNIEKNKCNDGFALIATISIMVLLVIISLAMVSLSNSKVKSIGLNETMDQARANAQLALARALAQLQETLGPDQRVTATASILGGTGSPYSSMITPIDGRKHWAGVWRSDTAFITGGSPSYSPAMPDTRVFAGWLVSSPNSNLLNEVGTSGSTHGEVTLFNGASVEDDVIIPKLELIDGNNDSTGKYAYWIEDEGVKANLGWYESDNSNPYVKQTSRLSSVLGPDYSIFEGPFNDYTIEYPISKNSSNAVTLDLIEDIDKASRESEIHLAAGSSDSGRNWLRENRHTITMKSLGVMADVKLGGLRRDLSLAFEMDGDDEAENATVFNQQDYEFINLTANQDKMGAIDKSAGMPVYERYLYRDKKNYNGTLNATAFSNDIDSNSDTMRGSNWWALRDYANLYKRLVTHSNGYRMASRPYFPNISSEGRAYSQLFDTAGTYADHWDLESRYGYFSPNTYRYIYRPARPSYAPVTLGVTALLGTKVVDYDSSTLKGDLAITVDPIFYIWNPYNVQITVNRLNFDMDNSFPGACNIQIKDPTDTTITTTSSQYLRNLFQGNVNTAGRAFTFEVNDGANTSFVMEPGEVVVVSPSTAGSGTSNLGYFVGGIDNSGIIINSGIELDFSSGNPIVRIGYANIHTASTDRFYIGSKMEHNGVLEELQNQHMQVRAGFGTGTWLEYITPGIGNSTYVNSNPYSANDLIDQKHFFGFYLSLIKPVQFGGKSPNPVEILARFNPNPILINKDYWRVATFNQSYSMVSTSDETDLLNDNGFNFAATPRNAFWGSSYNSIIGSTAFVAKNLPNAPLFSLAEFSNANLSLMSTDPYYAVGNSWSHPHILPTSTYDASFNSGKTTADHSWLMNDGLFDRYYLSGIAPEYTISSSGYSASGTIADKLNLFFSADYQSAGLNSTLSPYLPNDVSAVDAINELSSTTVGDAGYLKLGAYSYINGAFNINSTSTKAWEALLRSNRGYQVTDSDHSMSSGMTIESTTPFPAGSNPATQGASSGTEPFAIENYSGYPRLSDAQITDLAAAIVNEVKLRGPFMSISDFVNHRLHSAPTSVDYTGALQSAIDNTSINDAVILSSNGTTPNYSHGLLDGLSGTEVSGTGSTAAALPTYLTQAKLLQALAPKIAARSDTFRIRAYGEVLNSGGEIIASAICEAVVQRLPDYVDSEANQPWDELNPVNPTLPTLNDINEKFGRKFVMREFRWLNADEI